jgi:hypothetical protein
VDYKQILESGSCACEGSEHGGYGECGSMGLFKIYNIDEQKGRGRGQRKNSGCCRWIIIKKGKLAEMVYEAKKKILQGSVTVILH